MRIDKLLSLTRNCDKINVKEKEERIREIFCYQTWLNNWKSNNINCYYEYAKGMFEISKKMVRDFQVRMKCNEEKLPELVTKLYSQWNSLNAYIKQHNLEKEFDENSEYNEFKPLMSMVNELYPSLSLRIKDFNI